MNTAFDLLNQKYGIVESPAALPEGTEPQGLNDWKDSDPVVMLSAFLKEFKNYGFALQVTREGKPTLFFTPGLKTQEQDPERWDLALHARYLFDQARADLLDLIHHGMINLKQNFWI